MTALAPWKSPILQVLGAHMVGTNSQYHSSNKRACGHPGAQYVFNENSGIQRNHARLHA